MSRLTGRAHQHSRTKHLAELFGKLLKCNVLPSVGCNRPLNDPNSYNNGIASAAFQMYILLLNDLQTGHNCSICITRAHNDL